MYYYVLFNIESKRDSKETGERESKKINMDLNDLANIEDKQSEAANDESEVGEEILQGEKLMKKLAAENAKAEEDRRNNVIPFNIQNEVKDYVKEANDEKEVTIESKDDERLQGEELMSQLEKEDGIAEKKRKTEETEVAEYQNEAVKKDEIIDHPHDANAALAKKSEQESMIERLEQQNDQDNKLLAEMIEKLRDGEI